tara:strand:+ start:1625 stop:2314 length:690 start_codon:yes stop_codon:yes gene_type:complete
MQIASKLFSNEQRAAVGKSVAEAEAKTSAEIVPLVTTSSGRYDRAEDIVGVWFGSILMALVWWFFPRATVEAGLSGGWGDIPIGIELLALITAIVIGFLLGVILATKMAWLRLLFIPKAQIVEEVDARASAAFFDERIHHTGGATGLMFFVSLFERRAVVRADRAVEKKLGEGVLDELCNSLVDALKRGEHPADALSRVIADAGERLGEVLPRANDDTNEIEDALVIWD